MFKAVCFICFLVFNLCAFSNSCLAQEAKPDTISVGIYVSSVHDIYFKQKKFTITFWLWLKYKQGL